MLIRVLGMAAIFHGACACAAAQLVPGAFLIEGEATPISQPDGNTIVIAAPKGLIVFDTGRHPQHAQAILDFAQAQSTHRRHYQFTLAPGSRRRQPALARGAPRYPGLRQFGDRRRPSGISSRLPRATDERNRRREGSRGAGIHARGGCADRRGSGSRPDRNRYEIQFRLPLPAGYCA